jgi:phosphoenolpyruvate carboxykinase (ATP)
LLKKKRLKGLKMNYNNILETIENLYNRPNTIHLEYKELRKKAEKFGVKTIWGNYNFVSTVKNRSADLTVYIGSEEVIQHNLNQKQKEIIEKIPETIEAVNNYLKKAPLVYIKRRMGNNDFFTPECNLYVSIHRPEMIRLAYMVYQTLFEPKENCEPKLYIIDIPEWQEKDRQIIVFPEIGVTYVLGSDYYGEIKKGFLRMAMWYAKKRGMLGLHAGTKIVYAKSNGKIRKYCMIIFGLTATGKTTLICHNHGLSEEERIEILQDDVVFLRKDGSTLGTERGFYLKTEGLNPLTQPIVYKAATMPDTIFENVMVDYKGYVYFEDNTLTSNGRGIMQRKDLAPFISESINSPSLDEIDGMIIIFITRRNTIVPIISKLTPEQAAAAFMLGESIESSGGDPRRAGESIRVVGTNPFIIGDEAYEGNWLYDFIRKSEKIECYMINTGGVGEISRFLNGRKIIERETVRPGIEGTTTIIRNVIKGNIKWKHEPYFNTQIAEFINGIDMDKFNPEKYYSKEELSNLIEELKNERIEWLKKFNGLNKNILNAFL